MTRWVHVFNDCGDSAVVCACIIGTTFHVEVPHWISNNPKCRFITWKTLDHIDESGSPC